VRVDLSAVLAAAGRLLHDTYGWPEPAQHSWLDTVSFGIEFGPPSGNPIDSGPLHVSARISAFCLGVRTALLEATCRWGSHRSSTTSPRGCEQQMSALPSAGGSTGSGL
jgi:hypothetical protein